MNDKNDDDGFRSWVPGLPLLSATFRAYDRLWPRILWLADGPDDGVSFLDRRHSIRLRDENGDKQVVACHLWGVTPRPGFLLVALDAGEELHAPLPAIAQGIWRLAIQVNPAATEGETAVAKYRLIVKPVTDAGSFSPAADCLDLGDVRWGDGDNGVRWVRWPAVRRLGAMPPGDDAFRDWTAALQLVLTRLVEEPIAGRTAADEEFRQEVRRLAREWGRLTVTTLERRLRSLRSSRHLSAAELVEAGGLDTQTPSIRESGPPSEWPERLASLLQPEATTQQAGSACRMSEPEEVVFLPLPDQQLLAVTLVKQVNTGLLQLYLDLKSTPPAELRLEAGDGAVRRNLQGTMHGGYRVYPFQAAWLKGHQQFRFWPVRDSKERQLWLAPGRSEGAKI